MESKPPVRPHFALKQLATDAYRALACLDTERLEDLASECRELGRSWSSAKGRGGVRLQGEAREAAGAMAVFAGMLAATKSNLSLISRLREPREGRLEYSEAEARGCIDPPELDLAGAEGKYGDD